MSPHPLDDALRALDRNPVPELSRGFRAAVWQKIEARRSPAIPQGWLEEFLHAAYRPAGIAVAVAVSLVVGFGFAVPVSAAPLGLEVFSSRTELLTHLP